MNSQKDLLIDAGLISRERLAALTNNELECLFAADQTLKFNLLVLIEGNHLTPAHFALILSIPLFLRGSVIDSQDMLNLICNDYLTAEHVKALNDSISTLFNEWRWLINSSAAKQWLIDQLLLPEHIPYFNTLGSLSEWCQKKIESFIDNGYFDIKHLQYFSDRALRALISSEDLLQSGHLNRNYISLMRWDGFAFHFSNLNPSQETIKQLLREGLITLEILYWSAEYHYNQRVERQWSIFSPFVANLIRAKKLDLTHFKDISSAVLRKTLENPWVQKILKENLMTVEETRIFFADFYSPSPQDEYDREIPHPLAKLPSLQNKLAVLFNDKPRFMDRCITPPPAPSVAEQTAPAVDVDLLVELIITQNVKLRAAVDQHFLTTSDWLSGFLMPDNEAQYKWLQQQLIPKDQRERPPLIRSLFGWFDPSALETGWNKYSQTPSANDQTLTVRYEKLRKPYRSIFQKSSVRRALDQLEFIIDVNKIVANFIIMRKQLAEDIIIMIESHRLRHFPLEVRQSLVGAVITLYKHRSNTRKATEQLTEDSYQNLRANVSVYQSYVQQMRDAAAAQEQRQGGVEEQLRVPFGLGMP